MELRRRLEIVDYWNRDRAANDLGLDETVRCFRVSEEQTLSGERKMGHFQAKTRWSSLKVHFGKENIQRAKKSVQKTDASQVHDPSF